MYRNYNVWFRKPDTGYIYKQIWRRSSIFMYYKIFDVLQLFGTL